jgi:hypothetical protein
MLMSSYLSKGQETGELRRLRNEERPRGRRRRPRGHDEGASD